MSSVSLEPTRHAFWMRSRRGPRSSWLHLPPQGWAASGGVVICGPIGHEYERSYRTLLHLADELAAAGMVALRFDYAGCGSSAGDPRLSGLVEAWTEDIEEAALVVERMTGGPASLVGLRLGATLAARAASRHEIECLVTWAPVVRGARYVRDQRVVARFAGSTPDSEPGVIEAGGFSMSQETAGDLGSIDMRKLRYRVRGRALVLESSHEQGCPELVSGLRSQGLVTEVERVGGYLEMMDKPHLGSVPNDVVGRIVEWLGDHGPTGTGEARRPPLATAIEMEVEQARVKEELLHVPGAPPLFGVLTTPSEDPIEAGPLLLLSNGGSAHSVGPNRLHVEIARMAAAKEGLSTLRIDLRGLGDSIRGASPEENDSFPSTALEDLSRAIEWLATERAVDAVVLGGLCSGAFHALRAGVELTHPALVGVLPINPFTFRRTRPTSSGDWDDATAYAAVDDPTKWTKLVKGEYTLSHLASFAARAAWTRGRTTLAQVLDRLSLSPPRPLDRELSGCVAAGRRVDFICARYDRGYGLLRSSGGRIARRLERDGAMSISVVSGADHSFSKRAWRVELARLIVQRLVAYGPTRSRSFDPEPGPAIDASPVRHPRPLPLPGLGPAR